MKNKQIKKIYKNTSHVHRQLIKEYLMTKTNLLSESFAVGLPLAEAGITFAGNQAIAGAFRGSVGSSVSCLAGNIQTWYSGISGARGMAQLTSFLNGGTSQGMSRVLAQLTKSVGKAGGKEAAMEVLKVIRSSTNPAMQQLSRTLAYEGGQFALQVPGAGSTLGPGISVAAAAAAALAITTVVFAAPIALAAYSLKNDIVSRIEYLYRISGSAIQGIEKSPVNFSKMIGKGTEYDKEMISLLPFMFDSEANLLDTARTPAGIKPEDVDAKVFEVANDLIGLIRAEKLDLVSTRLMFKSRYLDPATIGAEEGIAAAEEALKEAEEKPQGSEEAKERDSKDNKEKENKPKAAKKNNSKVQEIQKIVGASTDGIWGRETAGKAAQFVKDRVTAMKVDGKDQRGTALSSAIDRIFKVSWQNNIDRVEDVEYVEKKADAAATKVFFTKEKYPRLFKPTIDGYLEFLRFIDQRAKASVNETVSPESRGSLYRKRYHGRY